MDSLKFYNDLRNFFWYVNSVNRHTRVQKHYYDGDSGDCAFAHNSRSSTELISSVNSRQCTRNQPTTKRGSSVLFAYLFLLLFDQIDNIYNVKQDSLYFFS